MSFNIKQLSQDLWQIIEPWFSEHANLFLLRGTKKTLLIDTGLGVESLSDFLFERQLSPDVVVTTHCHFDHCGGLAQFSPETIYLTDRQAKNISDSTLWGLNYLNQEDVNISHRQALQNYSSKPPASWQQLGHNIDLGDYQLIVISAPGHTDDSIILHESSRGWVFTGDTFYEGKLYLDLPNTNTTNWIKSLEIISNLETTIIYPGHNNLVEKSKSIDLLEVACSQLKAD